MTKRYKYMFAPAPSNPEYAIVAEGIGAGDLRNQQFVAYQDLETGQVYFRTKQSFIERMVEIETYPTPND